MFWAPCFRLDLPIDCSREEAERGAQALESVVRVFESTPIASANLALGGSAVEALLRAGERRIFERIGALVAREKVELLSTAMHDALLPLLPEDELARQLQLSDDANAAVFEDLYRPATLWPPMLAFSHKVAEIAAARGLSGSLVDEAALRCWPGPPPGDSIACLDTIPGFFLYPNVRAWTQAFVDTRELRPFDSSPLGFVVTAVDLKAGYQPPPGFGRALDRAPSVRLRDLLSHIDLRRQLSPMPSSALSTPAELATGLPFGTWFRPGEPTQAAQWRLVAKLHDLARSLHHAGLDADPRLRSLRTALDAGWRESWWRVASVIPESPRIREGAERLARALAPLRSLADPRRLTELDGLLRELGVERPTEAVAEA